MTSSETSNSNYFDDAEAEQLAADDSDAWNKVTGILLSIVTVGLFLGLLTVYLIASR